MPLGTNWMEKVLLCQRGGCCSIPLKNTVSQTSHIPNLITGSSGMLGSWSFHGYHISYLLWSVELYDLIISVLSFIVYSLIHPSSPYVSDSVLKFRRCDEVFLFSYLKSHSKNAKQQFWGTVCEALTLYSPQLSLCLLHLLQTTIVSLVHCLRSHSEVRERVLYSSWGQVSPWRYQPFLNS